MRHRRGLTLAACCGAHAVQDGLTALLYVLMPVLAQTFGLSYAQVGTIRAASSGAMAALEIPSGILSERLGERSLLVFGLACGGAGYLLLANAGSYLAILIALGLAGAGAAFQHSLSSSIITKAFEGGRVRPALGTYNSSGDVGKLAFSSLFTLLIGLAIGWQIVVAGLGGVALAAAILLAIALSAAGIGGRPAPAVKAEGKARWTDWGIVDRPAFTALGLMIFLDTAVQAGFLTFLAFVIIDKQVPANLGAFAVVLTLAGGVLGKFGSGFLAERLGIIRSFILVECLTAVGIVAVLFAPTVPAFLLLPLVGMVLQGSSTLTYGIIGDLTRSDRRSRGFAAMYSVASGASILAPIGFGLIGDHYGLAAVMMIMACVTLLPLPPCLLLRKALAAQGIR